MDNVINSATVMSLRELTGESVWSCRRALVLTKGDFELARRVVRWMDIPDPVARQRIVERERELMKIEQSAAKQ